MPTAATPRYMTVIAAATLAVTLGACSREEPTVGEKLDAAIAKTGQTAEDLKAEVQRSAAQAQDATERAADRVANQAEGIGRRVAGTLSDASVTASVTGALAQDPGLSALRIDVDTRDGRVLLSGHAPDGLARDRATRLARAVPGVTEVENRLQVGG